ncbi:MAG: hypothetical protein JRI23_17510 [Deltaproteobacteria bacterium]|nr:hypothetical protein [Deltaproteobacteria bacterium]MBW2533619.1 hypothetical protein [Deltaproteobacteria bacterium]
MIRPRSASRLLSLLPLALATTLGACAADTDGTQESDLTSNTARSRSLTFEGYIYVEPTLSDQVILDRVHKQTQTMFGPLKNAEIGVNKRELQGVDPASFQKTEVEVVDTANPDAPPVPMVRVRYRYEDMAVVPAGMSSRSALSLALMHPEHWRQKDRILQECTSNDSHAQEFASSIWYVFDPTLSRCQAAITAEQEAIDAENAKLDDPTLQVSQAEVDRLYIPTTIQLGPDETNVAPAYPEYDRLFRGGVEPGKLVIGMVNGLIDHDHDGGLHEDYGYREFLRQLGHAMDGGPEYRITAVDPPEDLSTITVGDVTLTDVTIHDIIAWETGNELPAGLGWGDRDALSEAVGQKIIKHWLTIEAPVEVTIGDEPPAPLTIKINAYFGAESSSTPHKRAIRTSDVFVYNGHSYIGYGPLDPSRFSAADFPASYQIFFIDGCVTYNYYEADYIPLKEGGTQNLDLITNGLEAPSWRSGYALGRFLNLLVSGEQASYNELLAAASATDELRVVDGELDNRYSPEQTPIRLSW